LKKLVLAVVTFCFIAFSVVPTALAKEPEYPRLSLNEAIEKAVFQSEAVKKAGVEIERTEALREESADQLKFTPVEGNNYNPQVEAAWASLLQADLTWQMAKKSYDARLDGIALDVCQLYWDVLKAEEKVKVKEVAVEKARLDLQRSLTASRLGLVAMVTQSDSKGGTGSAYMASSQAEANLGRAEGDLAAARNELDKAYTKLNQMVGLWPEDRPDLVDEIDFSPLEVGDLEIEVSRALERNPSVWLAQQGAELQKYLQDLLWAKGQYTPYDAREAEREQAELEAIDAKEAAKILVRDLYYTLKTLEESYKSAEIGFALAEEDLEASKQMYLAGLTTKADVVSAEAFLAGERQLLKELAAQYSYTKLVFQKPWAPMYSTLGSSGGSSSTGK